MALSSAHGRNSGPLLELWLPQVVLHRSARVAELADALASGASDRKVVEVRVLSRAPNFQGTDASLILNFNFRGNCLAAAQR